ncbi:helix-turn-helix domain-containing protein [bacterium RCC_150]
MRIKQSDVARLAGIHTSTLSRLLNDEEDRPLPMKFLGEVATALGLTPHVIAERAERRIREEEQELSST